MITTEDIIRAAIRNGDRTELRARRGSKTVWAGGRRMEVRTAGEKVLYLPNGAFVKITTDDSGVATQIEEDEHLHAIARPHGINLNTIRSKERS